MGKKENITLMDIVLLEGDNNTFKIGCSKGAGSRVFEFGLVGDSVCVVDCLKDPNFFPIGVIVADCSGSQSLTLDVMSMQINRNLVASWIKMVNGIGKVDLRDDCKSLFAYDDNYSQAMGNIKGAFIAEIMLEFSNVLENISKSLEK